MKTRSCYLAWVGIAFSFFASCASSYQPLTFAALPFHITSADSSLSVQYQNHLLSGKYAKKELLSDLYLVAVQIKNNSKQDLVFKTDIRILMDKKEISPVSLHSFYSATQQNSSKSLLFLILSPLNFYNSSESTNGGQVTSKQSSFYPIGLVLGPLLGFGNMIAANNANQRFKKDLDDNDLLNQTIAAGETKQGLIALRDNVTSNLSFERK